MENWQLFGILLQIVCGIVGGFFSFLLLNWGLARVCLDLRYRLTDLEGKVLREVKIRASEMSRSGKNVERELLKEIAEQNQNQKPALTLESWRASKFQKGFN